MIAPRRPSDGQIDYERLVDPLGVRDATVAIVRRYQGGGMWNIAQVIALFHFVRDLAFVPDPAGIDDYAQAPANTLQLRAGNCEGKSLLLASMFRAAGLRSRLLYIRKPPVAHMLVEVNVETYDLHRTYDDAAGFGLEQHILAPYRGASPRQFGEVDAQGHRWVIADPCFSDFLGDIRALASHGWMRLTAGGAPWTHPPVYFSDGSDRPYAAPLSAERSLLRVKNRPAYWLHFDARRA